MKIETELLVLTREHHSSLVLANKAINVARSKDEAKITSLSVQISQSFEASFAPHFKTEEAFIFKPLIASDADCQDTCLHLIQEHQALNRLAADLADHPEELLSFGELLKQHTRTEDRTLFSNIKYLSVSQRQQLAQASEQHKPLERFF